MPRIYCHGTSSRIYPLTLGHEFSGTIVSVGEKADPALIGRKGCFYPLIPCRTCDSCLTGNYAMCEHYDYMGSRCDGGFAEYCLVPGAWHFIESHNPNITFEELAMVEPACVAQHAIRKGEVFAGANVVIFGAGPIGIMAGRWARLSGANVLLVDVLDQKVAFARECGFAAVNSTDADFLKKVQQAFGGHPAESSCWAIPPETPRSLRLPTACFCGKRPPSQARGIPISETIPSTNGTIQSK